MTLKEYYPQPVITEHKKPLYFCDTVYECILENHDITNISGHHVICFKLQKHIEEFLTNRDQYGNLLLKYDSISFKDITKNSPERPCFIVTAVNRKLNDRDYMKHRLIHYFNTSQVNCVNDVSPQVTGICCEILLKVERDYGNS